jgi:meiotically up-regulated gene 157 (Mug157) protein
VARIDPELVRTVNDRVRAVTDQRTGDVFAACFADTLSTTLSDQPDGSLFMVTGDIPAMWLRDSTAQLTPYLHFAADDPQLAETIARISRRQLAFITLDPYANAFNASPSSAGHSTDLTELSPWVWERKYEVDSLCFPMQLAYDLWTITGRTDHLEADFRAAAGAAIALWRREQHHEANSAYRFQRLDGPPSDTLRREGRGEPVAPTGLTWSAFRPSDDACEYGYNVPGNAFAAVELGHIEQIARRVFNDEELAVQASDLRADIEEGIRRHGVVQGPSGEQIYAYEVDGLGGVLLMDDANVPSLLSLPLIGWCEQTDPTYLATRDFVLSSDNPYFYEGTHARGLGSPHTPPRQVWPIALAVEGLTATDRGEKNRIIELLCATDAGTSLMHESFHVDDPRVFTRPWFSWANAMFCELVLDACGLRTHDRQVVRAGGFS